MANFFKDESIELLPPLVANVAELIGDNEEKIIISDYCNSKVEEFFGSDMYNRKIIQYYLQLAKYADKNPDKNKYLNVYEPLM